MATIYIKFYDTLNNDLYLPLELIDFHYEIECLKNIGPDDGEAVSQEGKFSITCPDLEWRSVIDTLRDSGASLVYTVMLKDKQGEPFLREAGELNSQVKHYTTRHRDRKLVFSFWFGDCLPLGQTGLAA